MQHSQKNKLKDIGSEIQLEDIYTDAIDMTKNTDVYGNGRMQAMVFPTVSYTGEEDVEKVKAYVAENAKIYVVKMDGEIEPLDTNEWVQEPASNEFLHDIFRSPSSSPTTRTVYNIRVPLFFVVPAAALGPYRWIAELDGEYTNLTDAITVSCTELTLTLDNFMVSEVERHGKATLRALRYNRVGSLTNTSMKLTQRYENKGILFTNPHSEKWGNCWFVYNNSDPCRSRCLISKELQTASTAERDAFYVFIEGSYKEENSEAAVGVSMLVPSCYGGGQPYNDASNLNLENSRKLGISLLNLEGAYLSRAPFMPGPVAMDYALQDHKVQDNFGNILKISFDWDTWEFKDFSVIFA